MYEFRLIRVLEFEGLFFRCTSSILRQIYREIWIELRWMFRVFNSLIEDYYSLFWGLETVPSLIVDMDQDSQKMEVEETGCQSPNAPLLCVNNCGFFGSAATNNLCSKCYKDCFLKQSKAPIIAMGAEKNLDEPDTGSTGQVREAQEAKAALGEEGTTSEDPLNRPANRCSFCRKRVGLTGFKCRCEQTFCSLHRYSDKHNCLFDYKSAGQDAIAKANPIVKADKIEKI